MLCSRARIDGYRTALDEAGVAVDPGLVRYGDFFVGGGYTHGMDLLDRPDRPTAIFAGSDFQALGVMRAARELGLRVPEDLSIVGYDDLPLTEWIGPPLTTIHQPLYEMAATATRMVPGMARGEAPTNPRIELGTELVEREVEQRHGQATVAGGAVLSRITSSVPSSMRGLVGASPRAMPGTIRVAVAAIS